MKHLLITGGSGFIGKHLVEHFSHKKSRYYVHAPTHAELDLTNSKAVSEYTTRKYIDLIIHCANIPGEFERNMRMFWNLRLEPMIFLGSWDDRNETPHGLYKDMVTHYCRVGGIRQSVIRLFGVVGEGDESNRFIPTAIKKSKAGLPIIIDQDRLMDYVDVRDVCRVIERVAKQYPRRNTWHCGDAFEINSGNPMMVSTIAKYISELGGGKSEVIVTGRHPHDFFPSPYDVHVTPKNITPLFTAIRRVYES